jgi:hypothetical protein
MKTLTTLTATVALIAGMSVANAAATSSMSKSAEVIGTSAYCTKAKTGELICNYASLDACKSGAKGAACVANPRAGTTGSGSMNQ